LREIVAALRADHRLLDARVIVLEKNHDGLRDDLEEKHRENRDSIHKLRGSDQQIIDLIHKLDIKFARASGWAVGAGAVVAIIARLVDHLWK
jgi:hypothetical protein